MTTQTKEKLAMKTIGMLGGMSWESTLSYYKALNLGVKNSLGGLHSAKICLNSVDFAEIEQLQHQGDWQALSDILTQAALSVEKAGADFILICTNTMHKVAPQMEAKLNVPILHIADATAEKLIEEGITCVGLLGTRFTMEQAFYKDRLTDKYGIEVLIPSEEDRDSVHEIIYQELCLGEIKASSRDKFKAIVEQLNQNGAQGVILGCTEIALLIEQQHTRVPLFDTTEIHAQAAVTHALANLSIKS